MEKQPTRQDIARLFGSVSDETIVEILATEATYGELEEVALRLAQEDDVLGELRRPLVGSAARAYEILVRADDFPSGDREQ